MPHQENFSLEQTEITTQNKPRSIKKHWKAWFQAMTLQNTVTLKVQGTSQKRAHEDCKSQKIRGFCETVSPSSIRRCSCKAHPHDGPNRSRTKRTLTKQAN